MKILIIEDEPKLAKAVANGLSRSGFMVEISEDGEIGYNRASSEEFDLLVVDWMLPGMDGVQICKNLRKNNFTSPILMLTARDTLNDKVQALDCGADDYLTKPFALAELVARINALVRRSKNNGALVYKFSDIILNPTTKIVTKNGSEIKLSAKEYQLLEYLIQNKNTVLSKEKIIAGVWDYDSDILPNTVEAFIGSLRKKIDTKRKPSKIKTIRGMGYRLDGEDV